MRAKLWGFLLCAGLALGLAAAAGAATNVTVAYTATGLGSCTVGSGVLTLKGPVECTVTGGGGPDSFEQIAVDTTNGNVALTLNGPLSFTHNGVVLRSTASGSLSLTINGAVGMISNADRAIFTDGSISVFGGDPSLLTLTAPAWECLYSSGPLMMRDYANIQCTSGGVDGVKVLSLMMFQNSILRGGGTNTNACINVGSATLHDNAALTGDGGTTGTGLLCGGSLKVENDASATGETAAPSKYGLRCVGNLEVTGGTVAGKSSGTGSTSLFIGGTAQITGGTVTGTSTNNAVAGIQFGNAATVTRGTVTGTAAAANGNGILANGALAVSGGQVTGTAGGLNGTGLRCNSTLTVSATGKIEATVSMKGIGLLVVGALNASGQGQVKGTAQAIASAGINCQSVVTVADSAAVTGSAAGNNGLGVRGLDIHVVAGGAVTGIVNGLGGVAIYCDGNLTASGSAQVDAQALSGSSTGIRGDTLDIKDSALVRTSVTDSSSDALALTTITLYGPAGRLEVKRGVGTIPEAETLLRDQASSSAFLLDTYADLTGGALTDTSIDVEFRGTGNYVWVTVAAPPTLARASLNFLAVNGAPALNQPISFLAGGDRQGAAGSVPGDTRYIPFDWNVNPSGTFPVGGPYTASFTLTQPGTYILTVRFREDRWDGAAWQPTGNFAIQQSVITLGAGGTAADTTVPPTGDSGRMALYLALLTLALAAAAASGRAHLRKRESK